MPLTYFSDFYQFNSDRENDGELHRIARRHASREIQHEDIRQEFCADESVRRDYDKLEPRGSGQLAVWCNQRMRFISIALYRKAYGRNTEPGHPKRPLALPGTSCDGEHRSMELEDKFVEPSSALEQHEICRAVDRVLSEMPENECVAFICRNIHGKSFGQIAKELGVGEQVAKSLYQRAVERIREELGPE